ncbi:MAG: MarR family transcriptional regulator [Acidimicrobiales bacterium]
MIPSPLGRGQRRPSRYADLLCRGDVDGSYDGDGSRIVFAVICSAIQADCDKEWLFAALNNPRNRGGFVALRRRRDLRRWYDRELQRAEEFIRRSPAQPGAAAVAYRIVEIRERADGASWSHRGGSTDRVVLEVALEVATRIKRVSDIGLSVRDIADAAGIGRTTASKSLRRLTKRGWLRRSEPAHGIEPARYQVGIPSGAAGTLHLSESQPRRAKHPRTSASDCWRYRGGLGKATYRVWRLLFIGSPTTVKALANDLDVTTQNVRYHLAKLAGVGLAVRDGESWRRVDRALGDVAADLHVSGRGVRQQVRHEIERAAYREYRLEAALAAEFATCVDPETGEIWRRTDLTTEPPSRDVAYAPTPLRLGVPG